MRNELVVGLIALGLCAPALAIEKGHEQMRGGKTRSSPAAAFERAATGGSAPLGGGAYSADFEPPTFIVGDIDAQDGWYSAYGLWTVETANPAAGAQHARGTSDAFGAPDFTVTPVFTPGVAAFSIASADFFIDNTVTPFGWWDFAPQDDTAALVNTRVRFNPDLTISALVAPGVFTPTGSNWPAGTYFSIAVVVDRATSEFDVCLNGLPIFSGTGFAPNMESVAFVGEMAVGTLGTEVDFDNLVVVDSPIGSCPGGAPTIVLSSFTSTDSCSAGAGGGNSVWEPGETITIPVTLIANDPFTGVSGTMTTTTPGITILDGTATWPNLADGVPTQSDAPHFTIYVDEAFSCQTAVDLEVSVTANEGGPFVVSFSENVGAPGVSDPTGLPLAVPDNNPTGASSTITVGASTIITDINVSVEMTHTWVGDLIITLDPPGAAPPITLLDRPGFTGTGFGCADDNMDVTFDDAAAIVPETHCAATTPWLTGNVLPFVAGTLTALNGTDAQGVWTLTVSDAAAGDQGTIVDWDLILTPAPAGQCEICVGQDVDLSLAKSVAPSDVAPGDNAVFTLTATNNGPGGATGVVVTDTLPVELIYVSNDCGASFVAPTLTWNVGALAASGSAICNVTVTVSAAGSFTNNASVAGSETDPTPTNNAAAATVTGGLSVLEIPTLDRVGLVLLALLVAAAAFVAIRRS